MKRNNRHAIAIELLHNQIISLKHEQESQFIADEHDMVNDTQDIINQITSSIIALNELSVSKPLRNISKLRKTIEKRRIKEEVESDSKQLISFDTMWNHNQVCAIIPLRILKQIAGDLEV